MKAYRVAAGILGLLLAASCEIVKQELDGDIFYHFKFLQK